MYLFLIQLDSSQSMPSWLINSNDLLPPGLNDPRHVTADRCLPFIADNSDIVNPYLSPIFAQEMPGKPICPVLIQVGAIERIRDDGIYFKQVAFKNSPVTLEIYQSSPHVFQQFAPFDKFSRYALKNCATFIMNPSDTPVSLFFGRDMQKVVLDNAQYILFEGIHYLVDQGVWHMEKDHNNEVTITSRRNKKILGTKVVFNTSKINLQNPLCFDLIEADTFLEAISELKHSNPLTATFVKIAKKNSQTFSKNLVGSQQKLLKRRSFAHVKCNITQVKFPINYELADLNVVDNSQHDIEAEWVDYHRDSKKVVLYFHGGAYIIGSRKLVRTMTWRISKHSNSRVFAFDYRLAPQNTFPAPLMDAVSAYQYLLNVEEDGKPKYDPSCISFSGDSAGGGLAIATLLYLRDHGIPLPASAALFSPFLDATFSLPAWKLNQEDYIINDPLDKSFCNSRRTVPFVSDDADLEHPYMSPLFAADDSQRPLPPILIQIGESEKIRDDGLAFATKFANVSLELYEQSVHAFQQLAVFDSFAQRAVESACTFLQNPAPLGYRYMHRNGTKTELHNPISMVVNGAAQLVASNIWEISDEDGARICSLKSWA
jgi:acetyl esterase/lipase